MSRWIVTDVEFNPECPTVRLRRADRILSASTQAGRHVLWVATTRMGAKFERTLVVVPHTHPGEDTGSHAAIGAYVGSVIDLQGRPLHVFTGAPGHDASGECKVVTSVYLHQHQTHRLGALSKELGITQAKIVRRGLEHELARLEGLESTNG